MNKFGLTAETINKINKFFSTINEIEEVKIFGSRSKGNYKPNSDIDFAIYGKEISDKLIRHISSELNELSTPYKYDILDYKTLDNKDLIKNIDTDGKLFYKKCSN